MMHVYIAPEPGDPDSDLLLPSTHLNSQGITQRMPPLKAQNVTQTRPGSVTLKCNILLLLLSIAITIIITLDIECNILVLLLHFLLLLSHFCLCYYYY